MRHITYYHFLDVGMYNFECPSDTMVKLSLARSLAPKRQQTSKALNSFEHCGEAEQDVRPTAAFLIPATH